MHMKYIPAFGFGLVIALLITYGFHFSASFSPILSFITASQGLTRNSPEWLMLLLHDGFISLLLALFVISLYRRFLPRLPFNWLAGILMQLPMLYLMYRFGGFSMNFSTLYEVVISTVSIINGTSVIIIFTLLQGYNRYAKKKPDADIPLSPD
ncbi:conserved hypothetical protein [Shewanella halifaxensis HAW-EB4]|uniref:Uncharacterized protein n=2 Tax=Shewanella halifaxensis TaxID=271098 RepID=B0TP29_SHEHH|nr:conserved hypothetical protein [Shewanella halifaxensis HAW-EB4]